MTGGASGLGLSVATRITAEGGRVVLWDLNAETLAGAVSSSGAIGSVKLKSDKGVLGRIPAGRSVEYHGSFEQGGETVTLHFYYIYMGHSVLQLNCQ